MKQVGQYECTSPCKFCPYRKDTPVQHWAREEFVGVMENEASLIGQVYSCHKQNGSVCVGWLIDQVARDLPCIALRVSLSMCNVSREYLDKLRSPVALYSSVRAMVRANYPSILRRGFKRARIRSFLEF